MSRTGKQRTCSAASADGAGYLLAASASASAPAPLHLVYDVSRNLATPETHQIDGAAARLCVHWKGATRALPGHAGLPADRHVAATHLS